MIIPIVLYNGKTSWTAQKSFKEYLAGYELFDMDIIDFEYITININEYKEEELIGISNLLSSVFLIDQQKTHKGILEALNKVMRSIKKLDGQQQQMFQRWVTGIISKRTNKETKEEIDGLFKDGEEANHMVHSWERIWDKTIRDGRKEGKIEGKIEAVLELLEEISQVPPELEEKIMKQKNIDILRKWLKFAAAANDLKEFEKMIVM